MQFGFESAFWLVFGGALESVSRFVLGYTLESASWFVFGYAFAFGVLPRMRLCSVTISPSRT